MESLCGCAKEVIKWQRLIMFSCHDFVITRNIVANTRCPIIAKASISSIEMYTTFVCSLRQVITSCYPIFHELKLTSVAPSLKQKVYLFTNYLSFLFFVLNVVLCSQQTPSIIMTFLMVLPKTFLKKRFKKVV